MDLLIRKVVAGETYNIGGETEDDNIDLTRQIPRHLGKSESRICSVKDRPGHDRRYSLDTTRLRGFGWEPTFPFERGLSETVKWYRANEVWWRRIKTNGVEYRDFHREQHGGRGT